jgi:hypothetical protein
MWTMLTILDGFGVEVGIRPRPATTASWGSHRTLADREETPELALSEEIPLKADGGIRTHNPRFTKAVLYR